jgi:hypothetical protein
MKESSKHQDVLADNAPEILGMDGSMRDQVRDNRLWIPKKDIESPTNNLREDVKFDLEQVFYNQKALRALHDEFAEQPAVKDAHNKIKELMDELNLSTSGDAQTRGGTNQNESSEVSDSFAQSFDNNHASDATGTKTIHRGTTPQVPQTQSQVRHGKWKITAK